MTDWGRAGGPAPEFSRGLLDSTVIPANAGIFRGEERLQMMQGGWVYMMTNKPFGMLYIGVTAHLAARVHQHRIDLGSAYCRRYGLKTLVFAEQHETIQNAIAREKTLKAWKRSWKDELVASINPTWADLYDQLH